MKVQRLTETAPTVVIGAGAGIAAYKIPNLVRLFRKAGWNTHVVPTEDSQHFVGLATWQELSENPVAVGVFHDEVSHVRLARIADLMVIAPATADLLAKLRGGLAPGMLGNVWLASDAPKVVVPAMHTNMWEAPSTQDNVAQLRNWGVHVMEPLEGDLSSGDRGKGRMPEPEAIFQFALDSAEPNQELEGKRIIVTAGGTREPIDPVRYVGNRSSGRQGIALAEAAAAAGAEVTLIHGGVDVPLPTNGRIKNVSAETAQAMHDAVFAALPEADGLIMAAAVADFTPSTKEDGKIRKTDGEQGMTIEMVQTPDILASVAASDVRPTALVGFAAETGDTEEVLRFGQAKAIRKNADLLAVNRVGTGIGFGDVDNELYYFAADGTEVGSSSGTKNRVAADLIGRVTKLF